MNAVTQSIINAPIEYGITDAALADLKGKYKDVPLVSDTKGLKAIQAGITEIRGLRSSVESRRKELKADSLTYGRKVDDEAKRITAALTAIEDPMKAEKERFEAEKARIKREAEEAEANRIASIRARIKVITDLRHAAGVTPTSTALRDVIASADSIEIDDSYDELAEVARNELSVVKTDLKVALVDAIQREEQAAKLQQEEARIAAERAELEKQRIEQEQAEQKRREQAAAEQAKIDAAREAIEKEKREQAEIEQQKRLAEQARIDAEKRLQEQKTKAEADERRRQAELPDRERLNEWLGKFGQLQIAAPKMTTESGQKATDNILSKLSEFTNYATSQARQLGE